MIDQNNDDSSMTSSDAYYQDVDDIVIQDQNFNESKNRNENIYHRLNFKMEKLQKFDSDIEAKEGDSSSGYDETEAERGARMEKLNKYLLTIDEQTKAKLKEDFSYQQR